MKTTVNDILSVCRYMQQVTGREFHYQGGNTRCGVSYRIYTQDDKRQVMIRAKNKPALYEAANTFLEGFRAAQENA